MLWQVLTLLTAAIVLPLYLAQWLCWVLMRRDRLSVPRWRRLNRAYLLTGLGFMVLGGLLIALRIQASVHVLKLSLVGGTFHALIAAFHMKALDLIIRTDPQRLFAEARARRARRLKEAEKRRQEAGEKDASDREE